MWLLRKFAVFTAIAAFLAAFLWLDSDKEFKKRIFPANSLHNTSERGCSLAYRYLKESRASGAPAVQELNRQVEFAILEPDAVVIRIAPKFKPGEREETPSKVPAKPGAKVKPVVP